MEKWHCEVTVDFAWRLDQGGLVENWGLLLVLTFVGSAIGGGMRYAVSGWFARLFGERFPVGTLVVNVTGALGIGVASAMAWPDVVVLLPSELRTFFLVGFFGGYTTVSSYALNSFALLREGEWRHALVNLIGTLVLCLIAVWAGVAIGGQFGE